MICVSGKSGEGDRSEESGGGGAAQDQQGEKGGGAAAEGIVGYTRAPPSLTVHCPVQR